MNRLLQETGRGFSAFSWRRLAASCLQTTTLLGCSAIVLGNVLMSAFFDHQEQRALADARVIASNLNTAFEQHVVRSIKNIDQLLLFARAEFARDPAGFSPEKLSRRDFFPKDLALQIAVIGADGIMTGSSLPFSGAVDLSDREHYRFHLGNPRDELFISKPVLGRVSNAWSIQFTRKLHDAKGDFAGVLVASIDPYYLSRIYESIDIGRSGAITLWGLDGIIRARGGATSDAIGKSLDATEVAARVREANSGIVESHSVLDGVPRIISFRRVPGYPLVVNVAVGRDEALEPFKKSRSSLRQLTLLVDLALGVLMLLGIAESYRLRSMRENLAAKTRVLASTFANVHEGILLIDSAGMVVAVNELALDLLGLASNTFVVPSPYAQLPLAAREMGLSAMPVQQIALAGDRTVEVKTSALPDGGFVKTINDISERKQSQLALEDARDKAEAASRARTSFLATMSHEIRTPLGGVLSMVDLIAGTKLDPMQKRYIEITRDSATHLLQLIDDVLDVTKLDAEHVAFEDIAFDLYRQIRSTLDILAPRAQEKGLAIACVVAPDVPRELMGDPGRLRQVLINLIGNAIKFTAAGHVLVDVSCKTTADGQRLCVRVEDTGIGIAESSLPNLFLDFSQIDSSISRRFGGSGLGLAISRKLVTRMGGAIGVESRPGAGSVFFFDIPLRSVRAPEPVVAGAAALALVLRSDFERVHLKRQLAQSFERIEAFASLPEAIQWVGTAGTGSRRLVLVDATLVPDDGIRGLMDEDPDRLFLLLCARQDSVASDEASRQGFGGVLQRPVFPDDLRLSLMRKAPPAAAPGAVADPRPAQAGKLAGLNVLIAEDNPTNQFALSRMLETMGAKVITASNGREAVELTAGRIFDVVLMDVMMPELDGLAAARAIRARRGANATTPIIALTASAFVEDREAALNAGMNAFATKPITGQQLLEIILACRLGVASAATEAADATEPAPALDGKLLDQLREDLGADHLRMALEIFFKDMRKRADALRPGSHSADYLRKEAHALKGSAASFGFVRLAAAAARLEDAARANEAAQFNELLETLLAEADAAPSLMAA